MKLDLFINRPVLSTVISIFIVLLGFLGLVSLPITQYPDIAPPTIQVSTAYQGANAQTVLNSVIAPLEEAINGVENMDYMSSSATNTGAASIQITFKMGTDPDMAAVNVQNRVSKATGVLPAEVTRVGVFTQKRQSSMLMVFSLVDTQDKYSSDFIENYAKINLIPLVQRVPGVGDAQVFSGSYAMRIWLDPEKMASYGLVPTDVAGILAEQNIEAAPGNVGERNNNTFQYTLRYRGRLENPEQYEEMVIKATPDGKVIRLKDIARVELGSDSYATGSRTNGHTAVSCMVTQIAGSNATEIVQNIQKELEDIKGTLPPGMEIHTVMNVNDFLFASIHEVVKTLIEAFVLVFLVVFLFLQDLRSTLIPTIAIPVALIGTFFALYLIGFTINLLTLSALILAIAIVVDDAIVVVEGVHAKLDMGYTSARKASLDAMSELGGAILSITLVMMAVFIPVSFLGGTSGVFYRQFGITMAIAIAFSALNALTLSPALCAIFLKAHNDERPLGQRVKEAQGEALQIMKEKYKVRGMRFSLALPPWLTLLLLLATVVFMVAGLFTSEHLYISIPAWILAIVAVLGLFSQRFIDSFNHAYDRLLERYKKGVGHFVKRPWLSMGFVALSIALLMFTMAKTPTTLVPNEDTGTIMGAVTLPPGTSQDRTDKMLRQVEKLVMASPLVDNTVVISGFSFLGGQGSSYGSFIIKLKPWEERNSVTESSTMVFANLYLESQKAFKDAQVLFFQPPMITGYGMSNGFSLNLQDRTGGDLTKFKKVADNFIAELTKRPEIQSAQTNFDTRFPQYTIDIDAAQCKRLTPTEGPDVISRFNMFTSIAINGNPADGYTSGQAVKAVEEVAKSTLPVGYTYEYSGLTREEQSSGSSTTGLVFVLCFVFIYLLLAAQYESYFLPFAVLLSVPFGLLGAFLFIHLMGSLGYIPGMVGKILGAIFGQAQNNIYVQISLIMLMGLLAKNAILIVEFALDRRKMGMSITAASLHGAAARLRPILMTSMAMIIGLLPMMFAFGVGANGNRALGTTAVGGMFIGMICQIFVVPALFRIFQGIQEHFKPIDFGDLHDADATPDLEQYTK